MVKKTAKRVLGKITKVTLGGINDRLNTMQQSLEEMMLTINHNQLHTIKNIKKTGCIYISESEFATKIFTGLIMYLDPRDLTVAPHIAFDNIWEEDITKAWRAVIKPGDTVVDIGANFGYFGALAAQQLKDTKGHVVLMEANPLLIPYIKKTIAANWLGGISKVENVAVADKPGKITLNVSPFYLGTGTTTNLENPNEYDRHQIGSEKMDTVKVPAGALDDYCAKHGIKKINLIKMDIEGFEENAYQGMRRIVKASPGITMFIEFTNESYKQPAKFFDLMLKDFGHVYTINEDGSLAKPRTNTYKAIIGKTEGWRMLVFSKQADLHRTIRKK